MEVWQTILIAFGGNAALLAVLGWLSKAFVEKLIARDADKFKHNLELIAVEHEIRFLKLHETRAIVIAKLYKHLAKVQWESDRFAGPIEWLVEEPLDVRLSTVDRRNSGKATFDSIVTCYRYFDTHRIYLPLETGKKLDQLLRDIWVVAENLSGYERGVDISFLKISHQEVYENREKTRNYLNGYFREAKAALEEELRQILGDKQNSKLPQSQ